MSNVINEYYDLIVKISKEYIDEEYKNYDDWDELYEDMTMSLTGNDGSYQFGYDSSMVEKIIWEDEFISYCREELSYDLGELILKGRSYVECIARYFIYDYYIGTILEIYYDELREAYEEELDELDSQEDY